MEKKMEESRVEVYHAPKPWFKEPRLLRGFQYNIVGQPEEGKFYGVGSVKWWYQWNCPDEEL
jgi:hypothetical protein